MADHFGYLLVTSDPLISSSSLRERCRRAQGRISLEPEALALLKGDVTSGSAALSADSTMETDSSDDE